MKTLKAMPKPAADEPEGDFMNRCMGDSVMTADYPEEDQRAAVCSRQWDDGKSAPALQRKHFTGVELKKDKPGQFIARIATLNVIDKDGDVTLPGAFPQGKTILISAYQHGSWMGGLPVGKGIIREAGDEVLVDGEFNLNSATGKDHYETVKFAPELQEWSYGFIVKDSDEDTEFEGNHVWRILKKLDVFEASPVLRGAGMDTATLAIKSDKNGQTLADEIGTALAAVSGIIARMKSLAGLRRAEGRDLSLASKSKLAELEASLSQAEGEIKTLLAVPQPSIEAENVGKGALQKLYLECLRTQSKIMEVI